MSFLQRYQVLDNKKNALRRFKNSIFNWLGRQDSNLRMRESKSRALPTWLRPNQACKLYQEIPCLSITFWPISVIILNFLVGIKFLDVLLITNDHQNITFHYFIIRPNSDIKLTITTHSYYIEIVAIT